MRCFLVTMLRWPPTVPSLVLCAVAKPVDDLENNQCSHADLDMAVERLGSGTTPSPIAASTNPIAMRQSSNRYGVLGSEVLDASCELHCIEEVCLPSTDVAYSGVTSDAGTKCEAGIMGLTRVQH